MDGRCPCACTSGKAPMREPPKRTAAATLEKDDFVDEDKDPWKAFSKKRPGGGGDGGDGGHGGGSGPGGGGGHDDDDDDDDVPHFNIHTPEFGKGRKMAHQYEYGRLFEAKDAKFLPEFDGKTKAGLWRRKVSSYLITKYPEMANLLK